MFEYSELYDGKEKVITVKSYFDMVLDSLVYTSINTLKECTPQRGVKIGKVKFTLIYPEGYSLYPEGSEIKAFTIPSAYINDVEVEYDDFLRALNRHINSSTT